MMYNVSIKSKVGGDMKKKIYYVILAILSMAIAGYYTTNSVLIMILPFSLLGDWLRTLSLSGGWLNGFATIIWIMISLIPIFVGINLYRTKRIKNIDYYGLPILTIVLALAIYVFINPQLLINRTPHASLIYGSDDFEMISLLLNGSVVSIFYMLLIIYGLLKVYFSSRFELKQILEVSFFIVQSMIIIYIFGVFIPNQYNMIISVEQIHLKVLYIISAIFDLSIYLILTILVAKIKTFIFSLEKGDMSSNMININKQNYMLSKLLIFLVLGTQIFINLYQIIFLKYLDQTNFVTTIPVIVFVLSLIYIVFGRHFEKTHQLKEENELFI